MSRSRHTVLEYRSYELPADFPILMLDGDDWHISSLPSGRLHFHNCLEIGLCHTEGGVLQLGQEEFDFHAGYVTLIARNVPHTTWSSPGTSSLWSYLFLDPEALLTPALLHWLPDIATFNRMAASSFFILPPDAYPWAVPLIQGILHEMTEKPSGYQTSVRAMVLLMMIQLLRMYTQSNEMSLAEKQILSITPALDYIQEHYSHSFPQKNLADACHLSPTHFRRLFQAQMGTNPLNFLHQVRILKSCTLLRTSMRSVAEIAAQVGYTSLSCYNRHFQEVMGCTPTVWRKNGNENPRPSLLTFSGWLKAETPEEIDPH